MAENKINLNIVDGDSFFCHEVSTNFNALQFIFDFKNITPRMDPRTADGATVMTLKHNVVFMDIYQAKRFYELVGSALEKYEKSYGKIIKPKVIEKIEKERAKNDKNSKKIVTKPQAGEIKVPSYLG